MSYESLLIDDARTPDIVDETGAPAVTYLGWVKPGTVDTSEAKFKIKRITVDAGITKTMWANGNRKYTNIWDQRGALNYSFIS